MARKTVKRVKTGSLERRFSMARAGFLAGARYATASAGGLFAAPDQREARRRRNLSQRAEELVEELGQLKGSVVKIGQMMALFGEHFLPEEVTEALHTLENSTTALEWPAVEKHLRQQLGSVKLAELEVDPQPLGAASLGQVHRARRKSDGAELALKIQYPGVANAIDSDMRALVRLLKLSRLVPITEQFNQWLDEVRDMLGREVSRDVIGHLRRLDMIASGPRSPQPGAPYTYVTTRKFLEQFGLDTLRDLPDLEALEDAGLLSWSAAGVDFAPPDDEEVSDTPD